MKVKFLGAALYIFTFLIGTPAAAQEPSYDDLIQQIDLHQGTPKVWQYLNMYLAKAKQENNKPEIVTAYKEMLHESEDRDRLAYADSMVWAAMDARVNDLIGSSYLTKGVVYYQRNQHQKALDNYLLANNHLAGSTDQYLRHKVKFSIAQIKYYLGYYHEAISLFTDCVAYYKNQDAIPYLKSLHCLTLCYIFTDQLQQAAQWNSLTLSESARLGIRDMVPYTESAAGILLFKQGKYDKAEENLIQALPKIRKDGDKANEAIVHFFLGNTYWKLNRREYAIPHLRAVDSIFEGQNYIRPYFRRGYELLIKHYHHKGLRDDELYYIDQLLKADSVIGKEFRYLVKKVHKEYDTAELLAEKKNIQSDLERSRYAGIIFKGAILTLSVILVIIIIRHRKLQRVNRQYFEQLLHKQEEAISNKDGEKVAVHDINPVIVLHITNSLAAFERKKGFLKKDLTATRLAESFDTNSKYLSKVIKAHSEKTFINYINDLRIDYIVEVMKADTQVRRYNNGALADCAGFSTTQHFVTAFKKKTKISPGYFAQELEKLNANESST